MKKIIFLSAAMLVLSLAASAQTNVQLHYDFGQKIYRSLNAEGQNRGILTTTVEHFNADRFGSNFFFVDMDYGNGPDWRGVRGAYWEVSRELCFWGETKMAPLAIHLEYNGGLDRYSLSYDDCWLFGPSVSFHNADYSFTGSLQALYKLIPRNLKSKNNFQITGVWNWTFAHNFLSFNGFFDFWMENRPWQLGAKGDHRGDGTDFIFMAEPQIWFNFNALKGLEKFNLSVGSEVELSSNFVDVGFFAIPTVALKYTF